MDQKSGRHVLAFENFENQYIPAQCRNVRNRRGSGYIKKATGIQLRRWNHVLEELSAKLRGEIEKLLHRAPAYRRGNSFCAGRARLFRCERQQWRVDTRRSDRRRLDNAAERNIPQVYFGWEGKKSEAWRRVTFDCAYFRITYGLRGSLLESQCGPHTTGLVILWNADRSMWKSWRKALLMATEDHRMPWRSIKKYFITFNLSNQVITGLYKEREIYFLTYRVPDASNFSQISYSIRTVFSSNINSGSASPRVFTKLCTHTELIIIANIHSHNKHFTKHNELCSHGY